MKVLIADDEPLARERLTNLLSTFEDIEIVADVDSGQDVLDILVKQPVDVVFLDIHMPGLSGLDVADSMAQYPNTLIVFITAFDEHALDAFDLNATDYLTKPLRRSRLAACIERLKNRKSQSEKSTPSSETRLGIPDRHRTIFVDLDDIIYLNVKGKILELHTQERVYFPPWNLKVAEEKLSDSRFFKISRQCIVNLNHSSGFEDFFSGTSKLFLKDGTKLDVSRSATKDLKLRFE